VAVTEPLRKLEEPARETARGRDEATPARALAGVTLTIGVVAGVLIVALLILWSVLK
jgi:hypothetical protein